MAKTLRIIYQIHVEHQDIPDRIKGLGIVFGADHVHGDGIRATVNVSNWGE